MLGKAKEKKAILPQCDSQHAAYSTPYSRGGGIQYRDPRCD